MSIRNLCSPALFHTACAVTSGWRGGGKPEDGSPREPGDVPGKPEQRPKPSGSALADRLRLAVFLAISAVFAGTLVTTGAAFAQASKGSGGASQAAPAASGVASPAPSDSTTAPSTSIGPAASSTAGGSPTGPGAGSGVPGGPGSAPGGATGSSTVGAVAAPSAVLTETTVNPYGLDALWAQGDFVARSTLIVMLIMSVGTWYVGIVKLLEQGRLMRQLGEARESFWKAASVEAGAAALSEDSAVRFMAESGLKADANHRGTLGQHVDKHTWIGMAVQQSVDTISGRLQTGLAFLATVGSTAPFVGLFGTVWGIYHALTAIGVAGQASIEKVAGPVGEALIMTAIGLGAAVPAVMGYNWLVRRNKVAMEQVRRFASDLHAVLLGGNKDLRS
ncbi:MAG: MotA/TolQ/ExbB proton channel family protein [Betaproteobacteria bacterium]|nr:MotA/TolQ/ExbB proton channel family protein [Betaproteobacteria bacterium]